MFKHLEHDHHEDVAINDVIDDEFKVISTPELLKHTVENDDAADLVATKKSFSKIA